jgi:hypothetical protein
MGIAAGESASINTSRATWQTRLATFLALPWVRNTLLVGLVLLYTVWIGYQARRDQLIDFNIYYVSAYGFVHGTDIYSIVEDAGTTNAPQWFALAEAAGVEYFPAPAPYRYPPLTAQLVVPLLGFSEQVAGIIWLALTAAAFVLSAWWLGKLWGAPEAPSIVYLIFIGSVPALASLHAGQVTGFLLLAVTGAMVALAQRKSGLAGFALAIATMLKVLPLALIFYLAWRKQWLAFSAAILSMVALLLTVPLMFGANTLWSFAEHFLAIGEPGNIQAQVPNQSLLGVLARILQPYADAATIQWIYGIAAVALVVGTIALCWPMRSLPPHWRLEYGLIICTLMVIPPFNWYLMLVLLTIPIVVVVEQLWQRQEWGLLGLLVALYMITDIHGLFYHSFEGIRLLTSFPFLFVMLLWGLLARAILRERRLLSDERGERGMLASASS